ncbi:hypothetical protein QOZ80_6BG0492250 [Eleusine coracana subsp. coracana]|nr:hypothetical protein QOZ80_6BG0492250 [Eleusine coracana subsp. coracana]
MTDRSQNNSIWEHGENIYPGLTCKYCKTRKKEGGVTRFKQHSAERGSNVVSYNHVPHDVRDYFRRELDRTADKRRSRQQERLRREKITVEGNVDDEDEEELQRALHESWEEEAYARRVCGQGEQ